MLLNETAEFDYIADMSGKSPWRGNGEYQELDGRADHDYFWPKLASNNYRLNSYKYEVIRYGSVDEVEEFDPKFNKMRKGYRSNPQMSNEVIIKYPSTYAGQDRRFLDKKITDYLQYRFNYDGPWELVGSGHERVNEIRPEPIDDWHADLDWILVRQNDADEVRRKKIKTGPSAKVGGFARMPVDDLDKFKRQTGGSQFTKRRY